ncbi:MAG: hypothetical protein WCP91_02620 [Candidatus Berkelbacteria bacterium]
MRTITWLENRFEYIYRTYFADLEAPNQIEVTWGRRSRRQLGCIKRAPFSSLRGGTTKQSDIRLPRLSILSMARNDKTANFKTIIVINGLFKDEAIPEYVIDAVIVHEMAHYAHGFNSPLPQQHKSPHKGNVIRREFLLRGIGDLERKEQQWMKENWQNYLDKNFPAKPRKRRLRYTFFK